MMMMIAMISVIKRGEQENDGGVFHISCLRRSSSPFIKSWISKTSSIAALRGVSGVLRMGSVVLTSTSQRVSA